MVDGGITRRAFYGSVACALVAIASPLILAAWQTAASPSGLPYGTVTGRILAPGGTPVPDVRVAAVVDADPATGTPSAFVSVAMSDASGRYRLENIPPGGYSILAGTTNSPTVVTVGAGAVVAADIIQKAGFAVRGRLAVAPALAHSPPITVRLWNNDTAGDRPDAGMIMETALRSDLTFTFLNVPPGAHAISASISFPRPAYRGLGPAVTVVDRDIDNFELGNGMPGVRVTGKVTTGSQSQTTAPHDFLLIADGSSEVQQMTAPVSDDGSFEFLRIPLTAANGVTLRVTTANGYPVGSIQLPKGERDVSGVEIPLSFVALVSGQVVVEGASANNIFNLPETAAQILALAIRSGPARPPDPRLPMFLEGGIGGRMSVRTAAPLGGVFRLLIPPGRYDLGLRNVPDGYRVQSMTAGATDLLSSPLEVRDDAPVAAIRIVLAPAPDAESGPISGQILNWDGTPAISVAVAVAPANPPNLQLMKGSIAGVMQTDSAGRYRFDNIPPGRYVVAAGMPMFSGETVEPPVISAPTFYPGVADRPNATIIVFGGATAAPELRFRLTHPASPIPLFSAQGKVTGMTAANLNVISAARGGPWPGRTNLQVLFFSHPGTGVFPPVRGNSNSVLLNCGAREPGRLVNGPELLHLEGLGHVTPDGFYEVRNLPAGRYRACLPSGLGALTVDDIRVGPSNAIANFDLGPAPQAGPRGARGN